MERVYVGVLQALVMVPGARTRKDRRQVIRSMKDRVRARFVVSCSELPSEHPGQQRLVCTLAGNEAQYVRENLWKVRDFLESGPRSMLASVDVDVFPWHHGGRWLEERGFEGDFDDG